MFPTLNPPLRHWQSKTVWIIGASSGIGLALAHDLHQRGANVVLSARSEGALQAFVSAHVGSRCFVLDVCSATAVIDTANTIEHIYGGIDVVVFAAGYYRAQSALAYSLAEMERHQAINYGGAMHTLAAVLPILQRQQRGHLCLIASVAGFRGLPKALAYAPTKAALQRLAEILYMELKTLSIGVSVVNPGFVRTQLTAKNEFAMPALQSPEQAAAAIIRGWSAGEFEIHFPKRFTCAVKILSCLPHRLYFYLIRRFVLANT